MEKEQRNSFGKHPRESSAKVRAWHRPSLEAWRAAFARRVIDPATAELAAQLPPALYHYTTASGLVGIVRSGVLWVTDARCLNDESEWDYALEVYNDVGGEPGVAEAFEREALFHEGPEGLDEFLRERVTPFVACFGESGDLESVAGVCRGRRICARLRT